MIPAIDAVVNLWTAEIVQGLPKHMATFYKHMGIGPQFSEIGVTLEEQLQLMDEAGVEKGIMMAMSLGEFDVPYEVIRDVVQEHSDRFYAIAGINPFTGMAGVGKLEHAVKEYGFIGAHVYPHWFRTPPNDKIYYPFYAKCCELDVPIQIQIGHSAQTFVPTVARPILLDEVAIYFPELKIIGIHIGWPWVEESIAVAWKHPNVYIGCDAHSPKYWKPEFVHYLKTRGREKVIFGTDWPIVDFSRARKEIAELNLSPEVERKLYRENVIRVYDLPDSVNTPNLD
jgi:predicted TIM-barrel fold metal-dependent hydrolase